MTEPHVCARCGTSFPPGAAPGECPNCLADTAFPATVTHRPGGARPAPAGAPVDLEAFRRAVLELALVGPEELERFVAGSAGDVARVAREMTRAGRLTSYQAGAILAGKARGLVLGRYLVLDRLGRGGMGVVLKARSRATGRVVALKMLPPSFARDRDAVRRFRREFEVAARLSHPNVVSALDADEDRGVQFLTMEYVDGHDLESLVAEVGPLPIKLALHCAIQAARGLEAAHAQGVVHRDVKPANLMLDGSGAVRVLDLGLARVLDAANPLAKGPEGSLTQAGAYLGTVDYTAPEQADDPKTADHRADVYSLGCTLYFLLTGRPPFPAATALQRLLAHHERPAPSLHAAREDVPAALEAAYQTMMAKRPGDRPRSMAEVIALLEACRTSSAEAKEARAGLKNYAETVMKRAGPKQRRGLDASVFARPGAGPGFQFDPDLRLEDLVGDYRDEGPAGPLPEDKLPPLAPRAAAPTRRRRRGRPTALYAAGATAGLLACGLAFFLVPRGTPAPGAVPNPALLHPAAARVEPEHRFRPLFNGKDLDGWRVYGRGAEGVWTVEGGVLVGRGAQGGGGLATTRDDFTDVRLRAEVMLTEGPDASIDLRASRPNGQLQTYFVSLGGTAPKRYRTGDLGLIQPGPRYTRLAAADPAPAVAPGEWFPLEVRVEGDTITVLVKGQAVVTRQDSTLAAGAIELYCPREATARFRNIEVWEPPAPTALAAGGAPAPEPETPWAPKVIDGDEFDKPRNDPPVTLHDPDVRGEPVGAGYKDGVYFMQERGPGNWGYNVRWNLVHFSVEAAGRVLRGKPSAHGSWGLLLLAHERGLQILIDSDARLWIQPSFWTADKNPNDPRVGPVVHPAIKPGNQFNALRLNVRRRRLEVLVNNQIVCEPIELDWDLTPATVEFGIWVDSGKVRTEFDRLEIKELPPDEGPRPTAAGSWLHFGSRRLELFPGGRLLHVPDQSTAKWSRTGKLLNLEWSQYWDRVELDDAATHYRGANQHGGVVYGFRIPTNALSVAPAALTMNLIPAGEFDMGTSAGQVESFVGQFPGARRDMFADELPQHRVRITRPFYLGTTEVTVGQFRRFVDATGYKTEAERDGRGVVAPNEQGEYVDNPNLNWRNPGFDQADDRPVVCVSWNDAVAFCNWLSKEEGKTYRLPTEAEWEYACRAGTTARWANGDRDPEDLLTIANVADRLARSKYGSWVTFNGSDGWVETSRVGWFQPNAFGLYDTTGNAWEWCSDRYDATYYGRRVGNDPKGPEEGPWRVRRGGGWNFDAPSGRPADRAADSPERRFNSVGFRVARDAEGG